MYSEFEVLPWSKRPPDQTQSPHLLSKPSWGRIVQGPLPNQSTPTGRAADRPLQTLISPCCYSQGPVWDLHNEMPPHMAHLNRDIFAPLYLPRTILLTLHQNQSLSMTAQRLVLPVYLFLIPS